MEFVRRDEKGILPICKCADCGKESLAKDSFNYFIYRNEEFKFRGYIIDHCAEGALKRLPDGFMVQQISSDEHPLAFLDNIK
jgi:hypothetical protein